MVELQLTEDQVYLLVGIMESAIYHDDNEQTRAFKQRTLTKISQALVNYQQEKN